MLFVFYKIFNRLSTFLLDILFPRNCVYCKKFLKSGIVCDSCLGRISIYSGFFCPVCNGRMPEPKKICHPRAPYILAAATDYNDVVREIIHRMKYDGIAEAAEPISKIIGDYIRIAQLPLAGRIIVPIPMHHSRERSRGFNQAALIAEKISRNFGIPLEPNVLIRIKNTAPQSGIKSTAEKNKNICGCFSVAKPENIAGKSILLVDDIITSGATLNEACRVLKNAGAKNILALVMAKAH